LQKSITVVPAQAGIQYYQQLLDLRLRGGGIFYEFCNYLVLLDLRVQNIFFLPDKKTLAFYKKKSIRDHSSDRIPAIDARVLWL
jgi:hypothetical protein